MQALSRYHTYLYARPDKVRVQTDHKPLLAITKKALGAAPKRLQRMLLRLQRYNFDLQWVPGSDLVLADTLSRAVAADATNENTGDRHRRDCHADWQVMMNS